MASGLTVGEVYDKHADNEDGILYIKYTQTSPFGWYDWNVANETLIVIIYLLNY